MLRLPLLSVCLAGAVYAADAAPVDTKPATSAAPAAAASSPESAKPVELTNRQQASYLIGTNMAGAVKEYNLDVEFVLQGLQEANAGKPSLVPREQAQEVMAKFQQDIEADKAKLAEGRKDSNAKWLADNLKKPGVKVTASGLQYEVVAATTKKDAKKPTASDTVKVNYSGALIDGTVFDASANHGGPASFGVGQVIKGWTEGLQLMAEGDKFKFYIPAELAYGESAPPSIGPNQVLVFDVELVGIEAAEPAPATFKP